MSTDSFGFLHLHSSHDHSGSGGSDHTKGLPVNEVFATKSKDLLKGKKGFTNTFRFRRNSHSHFDNYDVITNFKRTDSIDARGVKKTLMIDGSVPCTNLRKLSAKLIAQECLTKKSFAANSIGAFTVDGMNGTFVVLNDDRPGFQKKTDAVIFLEGFNLNSRNNIHII